MYVCVCKAVSDRTIQRAVREDGVVTLRQLAKQHGVGTCCGKCVPEVRQMLREARRDADAALPSLPALMGTPIAA